ncbi:hypothetical protein WOLCODRAFT_114823 [Wolfiporia cocos MD-104 SS10]|uniref:S-adenosyl-L-methionine-dependent methyltransferase n=1 Tax=Wolfiporia cocos (strain MD-104) TaxID=742152 RepID=A0A2H3J797_WOLCO|nr:hypothetical protein WOLCODRAFT_114823 [Wolfiporia cocos MD-104 SS10]
MPPSSSPGPLPAHETKHLPLLSHPFRGETFHLAQRADGTTNGTALWLGAQCLAAFLADTLKFQKGGNGNAKQTRRMRAVELGSGVGLCALALSTLGWDVLATDLPPVINGVLAPNVARNTPHGYPDAERGRIKVRALDWTVPPEQWTWADPHAVALHGSRPDNVLRDTEQAQKSGRVEVERDANILGPPFDLILTADTLYAPEAVHPLLRTLHALASAASSSSSPTSPAPSTSHATAASTSLSTPNARRDPQLVDRALADASAVWGFTTERVPHRRLARALERAGAQWDKADWEGVEIWKLALTADGARSGER